MENQIFSLPIAILYGVRLFPIFDMCLKLLSVVRKEHIITPLLYKYLCSSFSSFVLSKILFPSITDLSKAPYINPISHASLLPQNVSKGFTQRIVFSLFENFSNFCTLIHPLFSKLTPKHLVLYSVKYITVF